MRNRISRTMGCVLAATLSAVLGGCAATSSVAEKTTTTTTLIYSSGRAPAPAPAPAPVRAAEYPVAQVVVESARPAISLGIIYFDFDRYEVKAQYRDELEKHADVLRRDPSARAVIEGHTDQLGSVEYNLALGQRRAEAVRRMLTLLGVRDNQLEAVSFGETSPVEPGLDEASRARNRRAEIRHAR